MNAATKLLAAVVAAAFAYLGFFAYQQWQRAINAEESLSASSGRVVRAFLVQAGDLRVSRLTGIAVARSTNDGTVFRTDQITRAPFEVGYFVDLRSLGQDNYEWDAGRRSITVTIPDVTVGQPSVDLSKAQTRIDGWWVSRQAAINLGRSSSRILNASALDHARRPEHLRQVQDQARAQVTNLIRAPMRAIGYDDVAVAVHFAGERRGTFEQWDRTRRPDEVLADGR